MQRFAFLIALVVSAALVSVVTLRAQNGTVPPKFATSKFATSKFATSKFATSKPATDVDFSKLNKNRFIARVQTLMHEARSFEAEGEFESALELASRANSVLVTVQRTTDATWPVGEQTPAEYIARLRETSRRFPSQAATHPDPTSSFNHKRTDQLPPPRDATSAQTPRNQVTPDALSAPSHSTARLDGSSTRPEFSAPNANGDGRHRSSLNRGTSQWDAFEELVDAKSKDQNALSSSTIRSDRVPRREVPDLPMNGVEPLFGPIDNDVQNAGIDRGNNQLDAFGDLANAKSTNQNAAASSTIRTEMDPRREVIRLPMNGVEPLFGPIDNDVQRAGDEHELRLVAIESEQPDLSKKTQPFDVMTEVSTSPIQPVADSRLASQKSGVPKRTEVEPRLLLEQLDRLHRDWEAIDDRKNSATKQSDSATNSVINANLDPFSDMIRQPENRVESPFLQQYQASDSTSSEPQLLAPQTSGRHVAAPIPTHTKDKASSTFESGSTHKNATTPEIMGNATNVTPRRESPDWSSFEFRSESSEGTNSPQDMVGNSDTHQESPWLLRTPAGSQPANSQTEHAHSDQIMLWVLAGIGLTLAAIWLLRMLMQTLFGVRMSIAVKGKSVGQQAASGASATTNSAARLSNELRTGDSTASKRASNPASVALTSDSMPAFPFRLVGGSTEDDGIESDNDSTENSKSKQQLLRAVYDGNVALQSNEHRDAA